MVDGNSFKILLKKATQQPAMKDVEELKFCILFKEERHTFSLRPVGIQTYRL